MANIFKTTLKKDVLVNIEHNKQREIRFPITKFWASRLTDEYNLDDKTFEFKTFDSLEFSSPSNKETNSEIYVFNFVRTFVDGNEFVIEFEKSDDIKIKNNIVTENNLNMYITHNNDNINDIDGSDGYFEDDENSIEIDNDYVFTVIKQWFDEEKILDKWYNNKSIIATNAIQVIILPNGKVLGFDKILPVNNDVEVRIKFDMNKKIYLDDTLDIKSFKENVLRILSEITKNNFVFVWKKYTGVFLDEQGRIYFGIKYSTRKSIGFNHKYNFQ